MKPKIAIITTSGPIAVRYDSLTGGIASASSCAELKIAIPQLQEIADIETIEFSDMLSSHMTISKMYKLAKIVDELALREDITSIVITHCADTLEETAYFLDLGLKTEKTICLTSVIKSAGDISPDGLRNLLAAIRTACCAGAQQRGVLVVIDDEIHAAREVLQTHTTNTRVFSSPFWGPLGYIDNDSVILRRSPLTIQKIFPKKLIEDVYLLKMTAGVDDYLLKALIKKPAAGIIIEGFGRGGVPPAIIPTIQEVLSVNIPVVITSRTVCGRTARTHGYDGAAKQLSKMGVVMAGEISGPKARIKLILALGAKCSHNELVQLFDAG